MMMQADRQRAILHYGRALVRKPRGVDKKGIAVALAFLVALSLWAVWRGEKTTEQVIAWDEQPNLSAELDIRPVTKNVLEPETAPPVQSLAGPTEALHDPRQDR
jgi:hypothetical protein